MLKKPQFGGNAGCHPNQKPEAQSPYKALVDSPTTRKQPRPGLEIADQLRSGISQNQTLNQDFCKRLQEIKRKYTSPSRSTKTLSTPMTPIDLNILSKKTIINQNSCKGKQQTTPTKNINKSIPDIPRPFCYYENRQPLQNLTPGLQYPKQCVPTFDGITDEERINSIDKINEKIKNILDGISHQNGKFIDHIKFTEPAEGKFFGSALSARPEQTAERRHLHTHSSLQKNHKPVKANRSNLQTNMPRDRRCLTKQFDSKMSEIQQRIKRSEENRLKLLQSYKIKEAINPVPSPYAPTVDKKPEQIESKPEVPSRQRVNSGMYSHRYLGFGKNMSRNILEELKAFSKVDVSEIAPSDPPPVNKNETRKLINTLVEQIKLDQQFRNGKIWLEGNSDNAKWTKLKEILSRKQSRAYTQQQIKGIFKCTQDDHNPFFVNPASQSFQNVVSKHVNAEEHWKTKLCRKFDGKKLGQQGFKADVLDLELKGFLQIEDVVRYLNIETGKFYRNRDLVLIFKRLTKNPHINFQELLEVVQS